MLYTIAFQWHEMHTCSFNFQTFKCSFICIIYHVMLATVLMLNSKAQIITFTIFTTYDNQPILTFDFFPFILAKRKRDSARKPGLVVTCSR